MDIELTKRFTEVYEILKLLPTKDYEKIPKEVIDYISENKNNNYIWKFDDRKKLYEQNLSKDTIAILSYINMEYLVNQKQKEFLKELYKFNDTKNNKEKSFNISSDIQFKKRSYDNENNKIIEYDNSSIIKKFFHKIKNIFNITKNRFLK